jgi:hypothetical protein
MSRPGGRPIEHRRVIPRRIAGSAAFVLVILASVAAVPHAGWGVGRRSTAGAPSAVNFTALLNGERLDLSSSSDPIVLDPNRNSILALDLRNVGTTPTTVRSVEIRGTAFGVTLMAYDVTINARIPADDHVRVDVPVEFVDLGQQTDGLLPATIRLLNPVRNQLAAQNFTVDVRGSASSLMTIFTIVVAIATGISIAAIWIAIARRRLPSNRVRRGIRLAISGAGIGVTLTLFLSELLLVTPKGTVWIPLLVVPTLGAFFLGYLSPGPLALDEEPEVEDWMRATQA